MIENSNKRTLVTAFMPFGSDCVNPTEIILQRLPPFIGDTEISKLLLPVEFIKCAELLAERIDALNPNAVIMLGQAGGRNAITPERVAINVMDASVPDNAGYMPRDIPIQADGKAAYFSTLPLRAIERAVRGLGISCNISNSAGTYVCNSLMYGALSYIEKTGSTAIAGFIHTPFETSQVAGVSGREQSPYMDIEAMTLAITEAVRVVSIMI